MSFSFYKVEPAYCDFLRKVDPCVPYTMDKKSNRPFVGIVFSVNDFNYYVPLTSPKSKHLHMKNQIDFLKIKNGELGAINFNNMIPVPNSCLTKIDLVITPSDSKPEVDYKNLLSNQLSWCNSNRSIIITKAEKLYWTITCGKAFKSLSERCCKFDIDEKQCLKYIRKKDILVVNTDVATSQKTSIRQRISEIKKNYHPEIKDIYSKNIDK